MVLCKRLHGSVQVVAVIRSYGWSVQAAMWWRASGYVVGGLQHFSVSSRPLGFGFLGFGAKGLGPGLDNIRSLENATICQSYQKRNIFRIKHVCAQVQSNP